MSARQKVLFWSVLISSMALVAASCSTSSPEVVSPTSPPSTPPQVERSTDGILRLGLLVPLSDEQAPFGPQLEALVRSVVQVINDFDGFGDQEVELVVRNEGTAPETARQAAMDLIATDRVDAVIGPFSSVNAPSVIPSLVSAGIGVCSPSVSSQLLDVIDDNELFFRTTAVDSAIVKNMVDLAVQTGSERVSIAYPDDPFGRTLAREMRRVLDDRELEVVSTVAYQASADDYRDEATRMNSDGASVELIIGDPIDGPRFLNAVVAGSANSIIIVNDALIDAKVIFDTAVAIEQRPQIFGFTPDVNDGTAELLNVLRITNPNFDDAVPSLPAFSVNTVDCMMLLWLAALAVESDDALVFKGEILRVANDGSSCLWIADCKFSVNEKLNIDYQGISGLKMDDSGSAVDRPTITFEFDTEGRAQPFQGTPNITLSS